MEKQRPESKASGCKNLHDQKALADIALNDEKR